MCGNGDDWHVLTMINVWHGEYMSVISIPTHLRLIIYGLHINHGEYMSVISITTHLRLIIYGSHINHGEYMSAMINVWTIYDESQMCGNGDDWHVLTMINV
jgi:hypothetical protein